MRDQAFCEDVVKKTVATFGILPGALYHRRRRPTATRSMSSSFTASLQVQAWFYAVEQSAS